MRLLKKALARFALASLVAIPMSIAVAASATWPTKPIRLIVPFPPGGGTDILARALGQKLFETFGQPFIVDNRGGAGGRIGAEMTARATPDGYTMCIVSGTYAASPALHKLPYDPVNGVAPISLLAIGPLIAVASPSLKANDLKELIALARTKPDSINFGSTGVGSISHLVGALLEQMTGARMLHVPYKGAGDGLNALLAGNIHLAYYTAVAVLPHVKSGKLRALGLTTEKRIDVLPDVPAIGEVVPGFVAPTWYGIWTTFGTPDDIIVRMNQALGKILQMPEVRRVLATGFVPAHSTPEEFRKHIARDTAKWIEVVRRGNIKAE